MDTVPPCINVALVLPLSLCLLAGQSGSVSPRILGDLTPCDAAKSSAFAARAANVLAGGDPALATSLFRQARDACPADSKIQLGLARSLTAERKFDEAVATAERYVQENPASVPGLVVLANALFMAQKWEQCSPVLERALKADPGNRDALLLKANNEYLLGNTGAAEQVLMLMLDHNPSDVDAAYTLGRIYYMDNRPEYAMGQFERVLKVNQKHYKAWDNLGLCYDALGNTDLAIRHFLTAIKLVETDHPEYDWPYANLADLLLRQNRIEEAYQAATKAAKRNPYSARNFYLGGQALVKLDRKQDALKWLERSIALDPRYPDALYATGQLYVRMGEKEKGVEMLKRFREAKANAPKKRR